MPEILEGYKVWVSELQRARSGEVDFGVRWTLRPDMSFPRWRVSWIEATGELYARELDPATDRYIVLGLHATRESVELAMEGWAEGGPKSLREWFGVPCAEVG